MDFLRSNPLLRQKIKDSGHEEVISHYDKETGLKAIVAIHSSVLGPALGGVRMVNYKTEEDALKDVLRLSEGMTYKAAFLGLNYGGGKAVIIGDPKKNKSEKLFRAFGRFVQSLNGKYITAKDSGIDIHDIQNISKETSYLAGKPKTSGGVGDPSFYTAYGIFKGLKAVVKHQLNKDSFESISFAIQGVGCVGSELIKHLSQCKAEIKVSDLNQKRIEETVKKFPSIQAISPQEILKTPCDILSPCALGGVIDHKVVQNLKCKIIAGAANNQLSKPQVAEDLHEKNIVYIPDFVINSGGVACVAMEYSKTFTTKEDTLNSISIIEEKLNHLLKEAKQKNQTILELAYQLVRRKLSLNPMEKKNIKMNCTL